jgi:hypothetical protein
MVGMQEMGGEAGSKGTWKYTACQRKALPSDECQGGMNQSFITGQRDMETQLFGIENMSGLVRTPA